MNHRYFLRHGIAVDPGAPGLLDDDRPLLPKGEARIRQIARGLKDLIVEPDLILTSPLPRARRTAEILAEVLGLQHRLEDADILRAGTPARSVLEWLHAHPEPSLVIVGHNPYLSDLVGLLLGIADDLPPFELKKGGIAALTGDDRHHYQLDWFAPPRLLRRLSH